MDEKTLFRLACGVLFAKGAYAWVDHYDAGEDDEKVIKIMLPMIAIAILACIMGYYIKNKFFKEDPDKEENDEKKGGKSGNTFPAPKANKPWLNMPAHPVHHPRGPMPGGYEYTLPGYPQATQEKRTTSQQSGKSNASSGYASHITGVHQVTEKRTYKQEGPGHHVNRANQPRSHRNPAHNQGRRDNVTPNTQRPQPSTRPARGQK